MIKIFALSLILLSSLAQADTKLSLMGSVLLNTPELDDAPTGVDEEAELGYAFRPQPRYLRRDVLPHRGDEIRENRRVAGHEDRRGRLVGHDMVTLAA